MLGNTSDPATANSIPATGANGGANGNATTSSVDNGGSHGEAVLGKRQRNPTQRKLDSDEQNRKKNSCTLSSKATTTPNSTTGANQAAPAGDGESGSETDQSYEPEQVASSGNETTDNDETITGEEIAGILPRKIDRPARKTAARKKSKRKRARVPKDNVAPLPDTPGVSNTNPVANSTQNLSTSSQEATEENTSATTGEAVDARTDSEKKAERKIPPIYYFFKSVQKNQSGEGGNAGDKHYQCYHGNRRILTVTRAMKGSQTGLQQHLRTHFPPLYKLWERMKERNAVPPEDEIQAARGERDIKTINLDAPLGSTSPLVDSFHHAERSTVSFDQKEFIRLLTEWLVASDQPFTEVENNFLRRLLSYLHNRRTLSIPKADTIRRRVMDMGKNVEAQLKELIAAIDGMVGLSLDAWSSSNGHAFQAVIMHYVTDSGTIEEVLIDFRELHGAHTGENMAEALWGTITSLGLTGKVIAIVMDNASNNDTLIQSIEQRCKAMNVPFSAKDSRMRCMPHTTHLAALELLVTIGVMAPSTRARVATNANYQQDVTNTRWDAGDDRVLPSGGDTDDAEEEEDEKKLADAAARSFLLDDEVDLSLTVIKLRRVIRAIRSSPQRREAWLKDVREYLRSTQDPDKLELSALMLILDVKTRWSSTFEMLLRALSYRTVIDDFVAKSRELRRFELSEAEWGAIELVTEWLSAFRDATTQMSATKTSVLSSTHAIFKGLQDELKKHIKNIPPTAPPQLRDGLIKAHQKLAEYFGKFDESPFYTWAALLDPRIKYDGLRDEAEADEDEDYKAHISKSKEALGKHFVDEYTKAPIVPPSSTSTLKGTLPNGRQRVDFTARYHHRSELLPADELDEYFRMRREPWDSCDPVRWWRNHALQFPHLSRLARDIFAIPGSAVAVERIFSGGRDTISIRRASLAANTIRTLMMVKHHLRRGGKRIDSSGTSNEPILL